MFDRSKQQIKITPAGELFRAKDSMSDYRGELSGTVDLESLVSFGALDVPSVLGEFHRTYPLVRIRLRQSQTGSTSYLSAIADGSLDLALISAPARFPDRIEMRMLSQEPMVFVCRPDHHLAQRAYVGINELAEEDLIGFPTQFGQRRIVEDGFTAAGITSHTPYEVAVDYSTPDTEHSPQWWAKKARLSSARGENPLRHIRRSGSGITCRRRFDRSDVCGRC